MEVVSASVVSELLVAVPGHKLSFPFASLFWFQLILLVRVGFDARGAETHWNSTK